MGSIVNPNNYPAKKNVLVIILVCLAWIILGANIPDEYLFYSIEGLLIALILTSFFYNNILDIIILSFISVVMAISFYFIYPNEEYQQFIIFRTAAVTSFGMMAFVLSIGPLSRISNHFLSLYKYRRHLGVSVFSLSNYEKNNGGECYVGNNLESAMQGNTLIEKSELFIGTEVNTPNATLSLCKNGNLILWDCQNNSCQASNGTNLQNRELPYDEQEQQMKSNILWSSKNNGGKTLDRCHEFYAGTINTIDASYGTNCTVDPLAVKYSKSTPNG